MRIEAVAVTSLDGNITNKQGDSHSWVSEEDQLLFSKIKSGFPLIVMGRKTYEVSKPNLMLSPTVLRVVLTHSPHIFQDEFVPNQLEFISETPIGLVEKLGKRGYESMLIAGGSQIYTQFFQHKLVNKLYITIEPIVFGKGLSFVEGDDIYKRAILIESKKINTNGTIHNVYEFNS